MTSCLNFTCGNARRGRYTADQCRKCHAAANNADVARSLNRPVPTPLPSDDVAAWAGGGCCGGGVDLFAVAPAKPALPAARPGDPPVGVVLGYSRWPQLIALQLHTLRSTCGPVPVLVSADPDPHRPAEVPELVAVCARYGAELAVSPERVGHTGGDLAAYWRGVTWGVGRGLRVVAKLSQRFVPTKPRWLQDGAADLLLSGLPAAARFAGGDRARWGQQLRTEAMLLDLAAWKRAAVLARLVPRKRYGDRPGGYHAEDQILDLIREEMGGAYWPWAMLPADRTGRGDGFLWRMSHRREEYDAIARAAGLTLPADFKVGGWEEELRRGEYDRG